MDNIHERGLVPYDPNAYDPNEVLNATQLHTSTSPGTSHGSESSYTLLTPKNGGQLECQSSRIKQRTELLNQAVNQLMKRFQLACIVSAAILAKEN
ncbi:uncharacterized protein PADG_12172 [Paracoccidioides brasiliensis Pb18]|uniref:Uncharacterized protein n=1 Tax=Paracoccidioides brasiliensis (strain Pb18) TaxID=502780 RepID=A0A0A0HRC4_PARBD|nr:uncharacterized protein PADG_12172 [Paracoccidioides brasiliensis Pb18]KGM91714.1 hypothetical protein PADG_12172 [Paracoccidioides brasiliensis Pb18]